MIAASPRKRRFRLANRVAASTAIALGAALLVTPGTATAQDDPDCSALGDEPSAPTIEPALEIAAACGVEVLIEKAATLYDSYFATPQGQLHQVSTVASAETLQAQGAADPTLVETDGALVQADAPWHFALHHDGDTPLIATDAASLQWAGETPTPTYTGSAAVYDDLAPGLDLMLDTRVSTLGMRFIAEDADAWNALAAGLTLDPVVGSGQELGDTLYLSHPSDYHEPGTWEQTTPFNMRDDSGASQALALAIGEKGALSLTPSEGTLETAAFPLTVTGQWTYHQLGINEWAAVTSASPDLVLFRGDGGLEEPYFEAAGQGADAVVGTYCDALVDPECAAPAQSEVYWNFWGPVLGDIQPSSRYRVTFPVAEATFRVDAAEGATCVAPDLRTTSLYRPNRSWVARPTANASRPAISGDCQDGTAVYDLTAWRNAGGFPGPSFGMTESAETARLDGGSARLELYSDIRSLSVTTGNCGTTASDPMHQNSTELEYGRFSADIWRDDLTDPGVDWTATITNVDTGATVFASTPAPVVHGTNSPAEFIAPTAGLYAIEHAFTSDDGGFSKVVVCHVLIDDSNPELIEVDIQEGPHYLWETIDLTVSVADSGFPDGVNSLTVYCSGGFSCSPRSVVLTEDSTASFALLLEQRSTAVTITARDLAGNEAKETFTVIATDPSNDFDLDGRQDLVTVRKADGRLMFHGGKGDGTFEAPVDLGPGWGRMDVVMAGDLTGDRFPDLLARDTETGYLYTYPGDGKGRFKPRYQVGSGWNAMADFTSAIDFDGDGDIDLLAISERTSKLYLYPGKGDGRFGTRSVIAANWLDEWSTWDNFTTIGDLSGDRVPDLLFRYAPAGGQDYEVYYPDGRGGFEQHRGLEADLLPGWTEDGHRYSQIVGGGDYNHDGWHDVYAVDARSGALVLRSYEPNLFELMKGFTVGYGWGAHQLPVADAERAYDYYSDGANDLLAWQQSSGVVYHYHGTGSGFDGVSHFLEGLGGANLVETAGDFNGDGPNDVLVRFASSGELYVYPGSGQSYSESARIKVGTGWNSMSAVLSGHDYNGDGRVDILAREKATGYLWLYPGTGAGKVGSRVKIGTGWNAMREFIAVGDLDHDGHADLLAARSSDGCMYFYGGTGTGGFKSGERIGCGWNGMDALASVGDFDNDGHVDFVARRKSDGRLFLYRGDGAGDFLTATVIGTGWNSMDAIA